jgi:hypothetical protein
MLDVGRSLVELLRLRDCELQLPPLADDSRPTLCRTGEMELRGVRWDPTLIGLPEAGFSIPIVARGRIEGHYLCTPERRWNASKERVMVALTLADQAASALLLDAVA